jgi:hypothetical protein
MNERSKSKAGPRPLKRARQPSRLSLRELVPDTTTWHDLPDEVVLSMLYRCSLRDVIALGCVDRRAHAVSRDQSIWRSLYEGITLRLRDADEGALTSGLENDVSAIKAFDEAVSSVRQWIAQGCSPMRQMIGGSRGVPRQAPQYQTALASAIGPLDAANEAAAVAVSRSHLLHDFDIVDWRWACAAALASSPSATLRPDYGATSTRVGNISSESLAERIYHRCELYWGRARLEGLVLHYAADLNDRSEPHGRGTANLYEHNQKERENHSAQTIVARISGEWREGLPHGSTSAGGLHRRHPYATTRGVQGGPSSTQTRYRGVVRGGRIRSD